MDAAKDDVVGIWQEPQSGAVIAFEVDDTFTATNLPYQMFDDFPQELPDNFDPAQDELPATGIWELSGPLGNLDGPENTIILGIRELAGRESRGSFTWRLEQDGSAIVLTYYIGDPDLGDRIVYERCSTECATPTSVP